MNADCDRIADQTLRTEKTLRALFFSDPVRLDAPILRCQLAAILRFYAERARRHGRISNDGQFAEMLDNIARVEMGAVKMVATVQTIPPTTLSQSEGEAGAPLDTPATRPSDRAVEPEPNSASDVDKSQLPETEAVSVPTQLLVPLGLNTTSEDEVAWVGSVQAVPISSFWAFPVRARVGRSCAL